MRIKWAESSINHYDTSDKRLTQGPVIHHVKRFLVVIKLKCS
jgi:hypothetical protein